MPVRRATRLLGVLLCFVILSLPGAALALQSIPAVLIQARLQPDGTVQITERRTLPDARPVEFLELLVPEGAEVDVALSDQIGAYTRSTTLTNRAFRVERSGPVLYLEWQEISPQKSQEILLTLTLKNALVIHGDAVEWYWPASTGSGGRAVSRMDVELQLPSAPAEAYLYAYGGEAGGVRVTGLPLRISATAIDEDETLEWRFLAPRSAFPDAAGRPGNSSLGALVQAEEARIQAEISRAERLFVSHWLLLLAPLLLGILYWNTVRRLNPDPAPTTLSASDLMVAEPAVVGWVYDSAWFDFACAQLFHLERKGIIRFEWKEKQLQITRVAEGGLTGADQALLALFGVQSGSARIKQVAESWWMHRESHTAKRTKWLKLVEEMIPSEWISRATVIWAGGAAALYLVWGLFSGGVLEWLGLWATAAFLILIAWKRRWLSAVGESHVARWTSLYYKATFGSKSEKSGPVAELPPEYLLAVEVGDEPLKQLMGGERYEIVKELYTHFEQE